MPRTDIGPFGLDLFPYSHMQLDPTTGEVLLYGERSPGAGLCILDADDMAAQARHLQSELEIPKSWDRGSVDVLDGDDAISDYVRRYQHAFGG